MRGKRRGDYFSLILPLAGDHIAAGRLLLPEESHAAGCLVFRNSLIIYIFRLRLVVGLFTISVCKLIESPYLFGYSSFGAQSLRLFFAATESLTFDLEIITYTFGKRLP